MKIENIYWVLGHRVRPIDTDDSYGMIEVTSSPHVSGPPPHFHRQESEFFLIIKGTLDVMCDGEWQSYGAGDFVEIPPERVHTFINNTEEDVIWVTGWRPKGFERFFRDYGFPASEAASREKSVSDPILQDVIRNVKKYGMHLPS